MWGCKQKSAGSQEKVPPDTNFSVISIVGKRADNKVKGQCFTQCGRQVVTWVKNWQVPAFFVPLRFPGHRAYGSSSELPSLELL